MYSPCSPIVPPPLAGEEREENDGGAGERSDGPDRCDVSGRNKKQGADAGRH